MDEIKASIAEYYDQLRGILDEIDELVENLDADEYFQLIVEDDAFCARNSWTEISSIFDGPDRLLTALRKNTEDSGFEWSDATIQDLADAYSSLLSDYIDIAVASCAISHTLQSYLLANRELIALRKERDPHAPDTEAWNVFSELCRNDMSEIFKRSINLIHKCMHDMPTRSNQPCDFWRGPYQKLLDDDYISALFSFFESETDSYAIYDQQAPQKIRN